MIAKRAYEIYLSGKGGSKWRTGSGPSASLRANNRRLVCRQQV